MSFHLPRVISQDRQLGQFYSFLSEGVLNVYKVAGLPTKGPARIAFVEDALADGETTPGSGTLAYWNPTAEEWRRVCDDVAVTA